MMNNKQNVVSENNNKAKPIVRKPSFKNVKPPEVKQTLTSKYRLLKANPLLAHELEKAIANSNNEVDEQLFEKPLKTLASILHGSSEVLSGIPGKVRIEKGLEPAHPRNKPKIEIYPKLASSLNGTNATKIDFNSGHLLSSTIIDNKHDISTKKFVKPAATAMTKSKPTASTQRAEQKSVKQGKMKGPLRRSLSAQHIESQKKTVVALVKKSQSSAKLQKPTVMSVKNSRTAYSVRKSQSFEELATSNITVRNSNPRMSYSIRKSQSCEEIKKSVRIDELNISTIAEESSLNTTRTPQPLLRTPGAHNRRSSLWTPNNLNNRRSLFLSTPSSSDMSERLKEWLQRRGKSLREYHHLRCFGIHGNGKKPEVIDDENKENIESDVVDKSSYEELLISKPDQNDGAVALEVDLVDLEAVAKDALQDLHKLILEGYPSEQCEAWLRLIKEKHSKLEEEPQYWECRAALEQSKGNINSAVECYKTAIIQGAEVQVVDKSLDQLLQKFSLLNINKDPRTHNENKERARIVQDARNIFKSSIIQFAVQERILKKKSSSGVTVETKVTATPVRRSTRLSRSAFTSTPSVKIYSSFQEATRSTPQEIRFQHNKALLD